MLDPRKKSVRKSFIFFSRCFLFLEDFKWDLGEKFNAQL